MTLKTVLLMFALMAFIGIGLGIFVAIQLEEPYQPTDPAWKTSLRVAVDPRSVFPDKDNIYVLILGTDYNYTDKDIMYTKNTRSDTMILARLDIKNAKLKLLSIPRDIRVQIPGEQGYDRINSAFAIGGAKLSKAVVQNLLGIPIDYHIRIKEEGLKHFVDAIGGIDLDVEKNMDYDDRWGHLHIHLKKGFQHLNGDKTAQYSRFRHDEMGDYGRIERQQKVVKAVQRRFYDPLVLTHVRDIVEVARKNVESNLSTIQIFALANLFKGTKAATVETMTLPTTPQDFKEGRVWVSYVIVQEFEAKKMLEKFVEPENQVYRNSGLLRIEVLNGTGIPGKAEQVAEKLRANGFLVARVGNADRFDYKETEILDHTGLAQASSVVKVLEHGTMLSFPQPVRQIDVTVIVGRDN